MQGGQIPRAEFVTPSVSVFFSLPGNANLEWGTNLHTSNAVNAVAFALTTFLRNWQSTIPRTTIRSTATLTNLRARLDGFGER